MSLLYDHRQWRATLDMLHAFWVEIQLSKPYMVTELSKCYIVTELSKCYIVMELYKCYIVN